MSLCFPFQYLIHPATKVLIFSQYCDVLYVSGFPCHHWLCCVPIFTLKLIIVIVVVVAIDGCVCVCNYCKHFVNVGSLLTLLLLLFHYTCCVCVVSVSFIFTCVCVLLFVGLIGVVAAVCCKHYFSYCENYHYHYQ